LLGDNGAPGFLIQVSFHTQLLLGALLSAWYPNYYLIRGMGMAPVQVFVFVIWGTLSGQ
jgi:hypothetical protein